MKEILTLLASVILFILNGFRPVTPTQNSTITPTVTIPPSSNCCTPSQLKLGYECIQDCGPPVVRLDDPTPGYSCLSSEQVVSRKKHGCPI